MLSRSWCWRPRRRSKCSIHKTKDVDRILRRSCQKWTYRISYSNFMCSLVISITPCSKPYPSNLIQNAANGYNTLNTAQLNANETLRQFKFWTDTSSQIREATAQRLDSIKMDGHESRRGQRRREIHRWCTWHQAGWSAGKVSLDLAVVVMLLHRCDV